MFTIYWIVFFIVFFGVLLIVACIKRFSGSQQRNEQQAINKQIYAKLEALKFSMSKVFYLNDNHTYNSDDDCKKFLAVDIPNKKLVLINYDTYDFLIMQFSDILNYEIYENGSNAIVGGNIGCGSGIFVAENSAMCKNLKLIIRLNRYDTSQVAYEIVSGTTFNFGISKSSSAYKECISTLQEVVSFLEVIKSENEKLNKP